ncbi:hypothetical protein BESB_013430 [Besnoitia besnoiti]|uniref:Mannose-P-dolichol utilization defect 1 protein n=1 Tax=Besnoitia besnoiti TaxID=94643 RepID=A0A2A9M8T6_BESBE|nr:hypothetical protein BESB_013430 [Besnoitia besnoiti]PFH32731.1 hypothetical protein BESB_013430 [Besnoitia besnoiti]
MELPNGADPVGDADLSSAMPVSSPSTKGEFWLADSRCTDTLFAPLQDPQCFAQVLSACLSLGVLVGGSLVKLPQLLKIIRARGVEGLAELSVYVEAISAAIFVVYNVLEQHPFTTWGEMLFVFFVSRLPQIKQNWSQKHTGQLSAITGGLMLCGNLARLFTSLVSLSDRFVTMSCTLATILNAIPLFQVSAQAPLKKKTRRPPLHPSSLVASPCDFQRTKLKCESFVHP